MAEARGESPTPKVKTPQNRALEHAFTKVGLRVAPQPPPIAAERKAYLALKQPTSSASKPKPKSIPKRKKKNELDAATLAETRRRRELSENNRRIRDNEKRAEAARRRAAGLARQVEEREHRELERAKQIERFITTIEDASFADLISNWKKHLEFIRYNRATGRHQGRLPLYDNLVSAIEVEWQRRSRIRHSPDEYFDWPSTEAKRGKGDLQAPEWATEGVLSYLGYHVGNNSNLLGAQRHAILRRAFLMHLPPIESPTYMLGWGAPESVDRLRKMANSLASFARQAKRRITFDMTEAVEAWETDLAMLNDEIYVGRFGFGWPKIG